MPRRKWRLLNRRESLSPAMRLLLERGDGVVMAEHDRTPLDGFFAAVFFDTGRARTAAWQEHGQTITEAWVLEHPGTRPWAWWAFDATEARRCVVGADLLMPKRVPTDWAFVWKQDWGVPAFVQSRPLGYVGLPAVESEAAYLARLGLLGVAERTALADDAFEPEPVNPFLVDADEIKRLVADDRQSQRGLGGPRLRSSNLRGGHRP